MEQNRQPSGGATSVVSIVSLGELGIWIARKLVAKGVCVRAVLEGRSNASRSRAASVGIVECPDYISLLEGADLALVVVPPSVATSVARELAEALMQVRHKPVYVDLNAISEKTVRAINLLIGESGAELVDGCIIGAVSQDNQVEPRFYIAGPAVSKVQTLARYGLDVRSMGVEIGLPSALKCCLAGLNKGLTALAIQMILASKMGLVDQWLITELQANSPQMLELLQRLVPDSYQKSSRWVGEMKEISRQYDGIPGGRAAYLAAAELFQSEADTEGCKRANEPSIIAHVQKFMSLVFDDSSKGSHSPANWPSGRHKAQPS